MEHAAGFATRPCVGMASSVIVGLDAIAVPLMGSGRASWVW